MTEPANSTVASSDKPPRLLGPLYTFIVTGLAVFLIAMAIWRPPVEHFTAEAVIRHVMPIADKAGNDSEITGTGGDLVTDESETQLPPTSVHGSDSMAGATGTATGPAEHFRSPRFLQAVAERINAAGGKEVAPAGRKWLWNVLENLSVSSVPGNQLDEKLVHVRFTGRDEDGAVQFVRRMTDQFVVDRHHLAIDLPQQGSATAVAQSIADAEARWNQAQQELDDYVRDEIEKQRSQWQSQRQQQPETGANRQNIGGVDGITTDDIRASGESTARVSQQVLNPEWQRLQSALESAQAEREDSLEIRTDLHPEVILVDRKIEDITHFLEITPQYLRDVQGESPAANPETDRFNQTEDGLLAADNASEAQLSSPPSVTQSQRPDSVKTPSVVDFDEQAAAEQVRLTSGFLGLQRQLDEARFDYEEALATVRPPLATSEARQETAEVLRPANIIARHRRRLHASRLSLLGLGGLLAGCVFALLPGKRTVLPVFTRSKDVSRCLAVPVVADLTTNDGPPIPVQPPGELSPISKSATWLGEWTLVAVMLLVIGMSAADQSVGRQLFVDPFDAYLNSIENIGSYFH